MSATAGPLKLLLFVLCAHGAALYLFTTGFFLTRFEVPDVSQCAVLPHDLHATDASKSRLRRPGDDEELRNGNANGEGCWMPQRYKRVVFVVVDALRYDFVADGGDAAQSPSPSFYLHHLPVFSDVLAKHPNNSLLLKFVADPPTMTMQRLKGLTTGSLPTFLDIKDNMASTEIVEDNLIKQMSEQQRKIVFMGDDTWDGLYARHFTRKYSYDSFNVKDLDTVDNGVIRHLFPELQQKDWGLLIAHFLGVDHVGHTHGPSSPFMTKKLGEMNAVMDKLLKELEQDEDTLLAVMGDHGMSADGNHGGATDDETGAALFLYSKKRLTAAHGKGGDTWPHEIPQVDLVPTLALLSGLPIPFGNLGSIIPQLFFNSQLHSETSEQAGLPYEVLNHALGLNVDQVRRYLFRYSSASKLPEREYDTLEKLYKEIGLLKQQLLRDQEVSSVSETIDTRLKLVHLQQQFLREALSLGRSIWTQFDFCNMGWGIVFLLWSLWLTVVGVQQRHSGVPSGTRNFPVWPCMSGAAVGFFLPGLSAIVSVLPTAALSRALVLAVFFGLVDASSQQHLSLTPSTNAAAFIMNEIDMSVVVAFVVVLLHILALLSNSYIVAEDKVMTFLSVTVGFALLLQAQQRQSSTPEPKRINVAVGSCVVLIIATRLASALDPPNIIQSDGSLWRTFAPLLGTLWLAHHTTGALTTPSSVSLWKSPSVRAQFALVVASYASCGVYWAFSPIASTLGRLWLPRFVFLSTISTLAFHVYRGIMWLRTASPSNKTRQHDEVLQVVSSEYVLLIFQVVPAYMLVLGPSSPLSVLCLVLQCLSFATIVRLYQQQTTPTTATSTVSWILLWSTVCYQSFFYTGHQNTFTSLQNAAAFVGFDDFQFYFAGVLLGFNTFGNYLIWLLFLPLGLVFQRPLQQKKSQSQYYASKDNDTGGSVLMLSRWWRAAFSVALYSTLNTIVSTCFVALQRRHLMVWAIFAPKFLFDAVALLILEFFLVLVSVLVLSLPSTNSR
ncbi:Gpi ethanolamine phosphate transferase 3, partial [Globisporangium splendens]